MKRNVAAEERIPRIMVALASAIGAAVAPSAAAKGLLLGVAGGVLATVASGYCPVNAAMDRGRGEANWRTIKTWRVEA